MHKIIAVIALCTLVGCKENVKQEVAPLKAETVTIDTTKYPEELNKVFDAHGGLLTWKSQRTLSYTMSNATGGEEQIIDLKTRKEKIKNQSMAMGFDGENFWLADPEKKYKGDPIFYHNLMFYFYAMPFVLSDDGIQYEVIDALKYDGVSYPGIRISFDDGVGVSSKDEYYLHYDAETYRMAWLGYTVTYRTGEKSDRPNWIRYNDWQEIDGLVLPNAITWHQVEDGIIGAAASTRDFQNVTLSKKSKPSDFYEMPENGELVTKK